MVVNMHESGMSPMEISQSTGRGFSSIYRTINDVMSGRVAAPVGRPKELHSQEVDRILQVLRVMVQEADGTWEVTLAMLMKRAKVKFSEGTVRAAMHKRRIWFRVMRSKPMLTKDVIKDRCAFGKTYCKKKASWWVKHLHLVIDLKKFPVFTNAKGRNYAAAREVRGVYRGPGEGLDQGYVRVGKEQRCGSGVKGVMVAAGIGNGRVRLWHPIDGNWCAAAADNLYRRPMLRTLLKSHPTRKTFNVLEDNDPTGFRSKVGMLAKKEVGIRVFAIPKRSPDLNPCDYGLWKAINRRMRAAERKFPASKKESRKDFIARLARTARGLPQTFINKLIGDMARRVRRLHARRGMLFEEGGK